MLRSPWILGHALRLPLWGLRSRCPWSYHITGRKVTRRLGGRNILLKESDWMEMTLRVEVERNLPALRMLLLPLFYNHPTSAWLFHWRMCMPFLVCGHLCCYQFFPLALSNKAATSHVWIFKFQGKLIKLKYNEKFSSLVAFAIFLKCSMATGG